MIAGATFSELEQGLRAVRILEAAIPSRPSIRAELEEELEHERGRLAELEAGAELEPLALAIATADYWLERRGRRFTFTTTPKPTTTRSEQ